MDSLIEKLREGYAKINFKLLSKDCQSFLVSRLKDESLRRDLDYIYMYSLLKPSSSTKNFCRTLRLFGFMKKREGAYSLTKIAYSLRI